MALLKPTQKKLDIPNEPGEWVEIRRLSSLDGLDMDEMGKGRVARLMELGRYFLAGIVRWSYPEPVTLDAIAGKPNENGDREGGMDKAMSLWLLAEIGKLQRGDKTDTELLAPTSPSIVA
jgi:hypothetical protein